MARFLCDSCKYDHPNACSNADRPNAAKCKDYSGSGGGSSGLHGWSLKKVIFLIIAILIVIGMIYLFIL
ncbi:MAG: hypothetical protein ACYS8W_02000 [Planctomycetota bacterium]